MIKSVENNQTLFKVISDLMNDRKENKDLTQTNDTKYCFMLHDEVLNETHKIEADELNEWLSDGSFQKHDKLYISFLIKEK